MRLFVSLSLTDEVKKCVRSHADAVKSVSRRGRFPGDENLHVTLAFIGEHRDVYGVMAALSEVRFKSFTLTAGGFGNFGDIHYVKVRSHGELDALAAEVKNALAKAKIPFDVKPFRGHITVGRDVVLEGKIDLPHTECTMKVTSFELMNSEQIRGKRVYKRLAGFSADE